MDLCRGGLLRLATLAIVVIAACAAAPREDVTRGAADSDVPAGGVRTSRDLDGPAEFAALEERLLHGRSIEVVFAIRSEGANPSNLRGRMLLGDKRHVSLQARGTFFGAPAHMELTADEERLRGSSGDKRLDLPRPEDLRGALLVGLTRMGLLHNLAMLNGGRPPDHADGTVTSWVTVADVQANDGEPRALKFGIIVGAERVAEAVLWQRADRLPRRREQTVRFADGEMTVVEQYEVFEVHG